MANYQNFNDNNDKISDTNNNSDSSNENQRSTAPATNDLGAGGSTTVGVSFAPAGIGETNNNSNYGTLRSLGKGSGYDNQAFTRTDSCDVLIGPPGLGGGGTNLTPSVPGTPQLNISRMSYTLPNFNKTFAATTPEKPSRSVFSLIIMKVLALYWPTDGGKNPLKGYFPILEWLPKYDIRNYLLSDFICGLTVAVFQIPQSMGYCLIAHVPPIYGLYSSFFPCLVYTILGTSRHAAVGAFALVSGVMTGNVVQQVLAKHGQPVPDVSGGEPILEPGQIASIAIANAIGFVIGCYCALLGCFRLGFISNYLSEQLISGFTTSASFYVFTSQVRYLLGLHLPYRSGIIAVLKTYYDVVVNFHDINWATVIISVISITILLVFKIWIAGFLERRKFTIPFPIELVLVVCATAISYGCDLEKRFGIAVCGPIPTGIPGPVLPDFNLVREVLASCISIAAVGFTITLSVGTIYGSKHGYKVDSNQELIAMGATNIVGGLFKCLPAAASLPRSAVQEQSGGKTQMVSIVNAAVLLVVLLKLGSLLQPLPTAVLASIIAVALQKLIGKIHDFRRYWKISKLDASVWLVAALGVIILDVDNGLYAAVAYSLAVLIYKSQRPKTYLLGSVAHSDVYVPLDRYKTAREIPGIKIFQFCGPLHFANLGYFQEGLIKRTGVSVDEVNQWKSKLVKRQAKFNKKLKTALKESEKQVNGDSNTKQRSSSAIKNDHYKYEDTQLEEKISDLPKYIIIDCSMFSYIDTSGVSFLKKTVLSYEKIGVRCFLAGAAPHVVQMLESDDFFKDVPSDHVFVTTHDAVVNALEALGGAPGTGSEVQPHYNSHNSNHHYSNHYHPHGHHPHPHHISPPHRFQHHHQNYQRFNSQDNDNSQTNTSLPPVNDVDDDNSGVEEHQKGSTNQTVCHI